MKTYTLSDAARAAGVSVGRLRMQYARGSFATFRAEHEPEFAGDARLLSANTVLAIAIANALAALGVALDRAAAAGDMFAHTGTMERKPGQLFRRPGLAVVTAIVVPAEGAATVLEISAALSAFELVQHAIEGGATILIVDTILERVAKALA